MCSSDLVEIKNSALGVGSKANHLSYVGDADVGSGVNIGAGTITCNYDGVNKATTTIGDGAFIGSNSALVAPVTAGEEGLTRRGAPSPARRANSRGRRWSAGPSLPGIGPRERGRRTAPAMRALAPPGPTPGAAAPSTRTGRRPRG